MKIKQLEPSDYIKITGIKGSTPLKTTLFLRQTPHQDYDFKSMMREGNEQYVPVAIRNRKHTYTHSHSRIQTFKVNLHSISRPPHQMILYILGVRGVGLIFQLSSSLSAHQLVEYTVYTNQYLKTEWKSIMESNLVKVPTLDQLTYFTTD